MRVAIRIAFLVVGDELRSGEHASRRVPGPEFIAPQVGMFEKLILQPNSSVGSRVRKFRQALEKGLPFLRKENGLIFLCGANKDINTPSKRREAVKRFIESCSQDYRVVYAEPFFEEFSKENSRRKEFNLLDLEDDISSISDLIIIILESPGSICELGAFSRALFRSKLVVINNSDYLNQDSFINGGPLKAVSDGKGRVLWYEMRSNGITQLDGIGSVFADIGKILSLTLGRKTRSRVPKIIPLGVDKPSLYFIHDVIHFMGPVSYTEIVKFLIALFGPNGSYDALKKILAILKSSEMVCSREVSTGNGKKEWVYRALSKETYLDYEFDTYPLIASMRRENFLRNPWRF